jgi:hypothetical protein
MWRFDGRDSHDGSHYVFRLSGAGPFPARYVEVDVAYFWGDR